MGFSKSSAKGKVKVKMKSLSHARLLATPWTGAHQAPLSMGFSRQEYWSGVPLPSPVLSGECVISSVLSRRSKNLKQWTSVTAQLQLRFIWQVKENTSSRREDGPTQKKRGAQFWLLFNLLSPPLEPALCKLG